MHIKQMPKASPLMESYMSGIHRQSSNAFKRLITKVDLSEFLVRNHVLFA